MSRAVALLVVARIVVAHEHATRAREAPLTHVLLLAMRCEHEQPMSTNNFKHVPMNANFNKYYLASRRIQCDDRWGSIRIRASREAKSKHSRTSADHRISRQRRDLGSSRSRPVFAHLHNVSSSRDEMQVDRIETTRTPTCRSSCCLLTCRRTCWSPRLRSHWDTRSSFAKLLQLRKCSTHVLVT